MSKLGGWSGRSIRSFTTLKFCHVFYYICQGTTMFCFGLCLFLLVPKLLVFPNQPDSVMAMGKSRSVIFPREGSGSRGLAVSAPGIRHLAPVLDLGGFYLPNIHFFYFFHHPFLKHYLSLLLILCGAGQTDMAPTEEQTFD